LAERIAAEAGPDRRSQVLRAWQLAYGVKPAAEVMDELMVFVERQTAAFGRVKRKDDSATPGKLAMASLCQALISANRFLYID
jgi:hypothetical protein